MPFTIALAPSTQAPPIIPKWRLRHQRNVLFYFFNYDKTPPTRSGISMFPLLPSLGLEASF